MKPGPLSSKSLLEDKFLKMIELEMTHELENSKGLLTKSPLLHKEDRVIGGKLGYRFTTMNC